MGVGINDIGICFCSLDVLRWSRTFGSLLLALDSSDCRVLRVIVNGDKKDK